jgi:hypothetical protein
VGEARAAAAAAAAVAAAAAAATARRSEEIGERERVVMWSGNLNKQHFSSQALIR